ncbi:hypothetical protein EV653_0475 [Kribbella pratensis]|uniref:Uncharacterized protein n=1 Tax=Kribbella pratensis TaxID=2512112 RepID=A0A4R8CGB7_9ACTN|nr:hypothetical protein EV653_0475 [Kribbella pratensis]
MNFDMAAQTADGDRSGRGIVRDSFKPWGGIPV